MAKGMQGQQHCTDCTVPVLLVIVPVFMWCLRTPFTARGMAAVCGTWCCLGRKRPRCVACRAIADATHASAMVDSVQKMFSSACEALEQWNEDLRIREKKNAKLQLARGAVPDSVQQAFDEQKTKYVYLPLLTRI
jgi:hypothetical protein